jgi:hypothetical protein
VVGLAGCAPNANKTQGRGGSTTLTFVSDQFQPVDEAEKMRKQILAGFDGKVNFVSSMVGPFTDRVTSQALSGGVLRGADVPGLRAGAASRGTSWRPPTCSAPGSGSGCATWCCRCSSRASGSR